MPKAKAYRHPYEEKTMTDTKEFAENSPVAFSNDERAELNLNPRILARMRRISEYYDETLCREYREAEMRAERAVFDKVTSESVNFIESNPESVTVTSTHLTIEQQDKLDALAQTVYQYGRQIGQLKQAYDQNENSMQQLVDGQGRNDTAIADHQEEIVCLRQEIEQLRQENAQFKLEVGEIKEIMQRLAGSTEHSLDQNSPLETPSMEIHEHSFEPGVESMGLEAQSQEPEAESLTLEEQPQEPEAESLTLEEQPLESEAESLEHDEQSLASESKVSPASEVTFDTLLQHYNITRSELVSMLQSRFESWNEKTLKELATHMYLFFKEGNMPATLDELINTAYVKLRFAEKKEDLG
jgi:phage shock protein A